MSRLLAILTAMFATAAVRAGDTPPEKLLAPGTQVYVRWDGVTPHMAAYKASVWGGIMAGPTGENLMTFVDRVPKYLGSGLLSEPLLQGQPLEELRKVQTDVKLIGKLPDVIKDHGAIVAIEARPPSNIAAGLLKAVGLGKADEKKKDPTADFLPEVRAFLIVPNVGERAEALFAPTRLFNRSAVKAQEATPIPAELKVKGFFWPEVPGSPIHMGEWVMDGHYVEYVGTAPAATAIAEMRKNATAGGLTGHPLFQRVQKMNGFESVARGFADTGSAVSLLKQLAGPFVPGLDRRIDDVGLGQVKAIVFTSGFDGREARATYEFDVPGERKGFAKILKREPVDLKDLPPLPPDCSRFSALRVDWNAAFEGGVALIQGLATQDFGVEEGKKTIDEKIAARRKFLTEELDKAVGVSVKEDLLPYLGDLFVMYQSPCEGVQVFGQCVAVSCKDPAAVRAAADRIQRAIDGIAGGRMRVRKKTYAGVEMREIYSREFGVVTPSYAVVGNWLVFGGHPQVVQGFILRHKGDLPTWRPDADTAARIAKLPSDRVGLQYCNPNSTAQNMCCIGPLFLAAITRFGPNRNEFDPPDLGMIPNAHELGRHLFSNLAATRDDGKTIRIEVNESLSLPLDFMGFDPIIFSIMTGLAQF